MVTIARRLESICRGIDSAKERKDICEQYRMTFVLLMLILEEHKRLKNVVVDIERRNNKLNTLPTRYHSDECTHHSRRRGWGRSSRSSGCTVDYWGRSVLKPMKPVDANDYHKKVSDVCYDQMQFNADLTTLQQYCDAFAAYRQTLLETKVRNKIQRELQNILLVSQIGICWERQSITNNDVCGVVNGRFTKLVDVGNILYACKDKLNNKIGKIGRESYTEGYRLVSMSMFKHGNRKSDKGLCERYTGSRSPSSRAGLVESYVKTSKRYQDRLSWIVGLKDIHQALKILPYVDDWKEKYAATNRLAYMTALSRPYVKSIVTSQIEQVGTIEHLETNVPVYRSECLLWEGTQQRQYCYFLGKTGSTVVDNACRVEWYHCQIQTTTDNKNLADRRVINELRQRLSYQRNQKLSLLERRKEIATYARKLTWLETMSMMDSKNAGNCLPGTIQFAEELGLPCPSDWKDYTIDCRQLLRAWKSKGYGGNRLLLPAIDKAVDRVKQTLCQLTVSCYVPSVVR